MFVITGKQIKVDNNKARGVFTGTHGKGRNKGGKSKDEYSKALNQIASKNEPNSQFFHGLVAKKANNYPQNNVQNNQQQFLAQNNYPAPYQSKIQPKFNNKQTYTKFQQQSQHYYNNQNIYHTQTSFYSQEPDQMRDSTRYHQQGEHHGKRNSQHQLSLPHQQNIKSDHHSQMKFDFQYHQNSTHSNIPKIHQKDYPSEGSTQHIKRKSTYQSTSNTPSSNNSSPTSLVPATNNMYLSNRSLIVNSSNRKNSSHNGGISASSKKHSLSNRMNEMNRLNPATTSLGTPKNSVHVPDTIELHDFSTDKTLTIPANAPLTSWNLNNNSPMSNTGQLTEYSEAETETVFLVSNALNALTVFIENEEAAMDKESVKESEKLTDDNRKT